MKRIPATLGALSLLLLLTVASCTSTLSDEPTTDIRAISFMPTAETRAAVTGTSLPDGSSFSVWGGYDNDATNVFKGETVTEENDVWTYGDDYRYWIAGKTYNFYAVYPTDVKADVSSYGTITVTNFDCSKTGSEAVDLMTATATGNDSNPAPVALTFNHELAKVNVNIRTEESTATVVDATMWGIGYRGNFSKSNGNAQWEILTQATEESSPFTRTKEATIDKLGIPLLNEMLLPPQDITNTQGATIYVSYRYTGDNVPTEKEVTLPAITWAAGKSYTYTLTIEPDGRIHFDPPTINKWGEAQGGIIIVA